MIYRNGIMNMKDRGIMICCLSDDHGVDGGCIVETDYLVR